MGMVFIMVVVIDVIVMVVDRWWSLWRGCSLWLVIMVVGRCCGWSLLWLVIVVAGCHNGWSSGWLVVVVDVMVVVYIAIGRHAATLPQ